MELSQLNQVEEVELFGVSYGVTTTTSVECNPDCEDFPSTGTIPTEIGLLTVLRQLDRWGQWISGTIPTEIGLLTLLTSLSISGPYSNANLAGTIPIELAMLSELGELVVHGQKMGGALPTELGLLPALWTLDVKIGLYRTGFLLAEMCHMTDLNLPEWGGKVKDLVADESQCCAVCEDNEIAKATSGNHSGLESASDNQGNHSGLENANTKSRDPSSASLDWLLVLFGQTALGILLL